MVKTVTFYSATRAMEYKGERVEIAGDVILLDDFPIARFLATYWRLLNPDGHGETDPRAYYQITVK